MVILRPTQDLANRMGIKLSAAPAGLSSTTRLGDWYALGLVLHRRQFIMAMSSVSRLAVVMDAAPYASWSSRLSAELSRVLHAIGVSESAVGSELAEMSDMVFAKTTDRSIVGSLNEFRFQLEARAAMARFGDDLSPFCRHLACRSI